MHWVKERVFEYEDLTAPGVRGCMRVHCRLRNDGSMWYQPYVMDTAPENYLARLEIKFDDFLGRVVPRGIRSGWTEKDFDEDFVDRLQRMNGKEITQLERTAQ